MLIPTYQQLLKRNMMFAGRTLVPVIFAPAITTAAQAQGVVHFPGLTAAIGTIERSWLLGGALAVVIGVVFGVFPFMCRNIAQGFMAIGGGLFAGILIGTHLSGLARSPGRAFR